MKDIMDKIDAVILFVDMNDNEWRNRYNKFIEKHEIPNKHINNEHRFRDYGTLKCVLRGIDLYTPWINNVFLVVQSDSQVPRWVNRDTVKVVLHEEFIPKEYLPTFNCNTIETHLHFIPGLSEKFIYFNDDMLFSRKIQPEDFFIGNKCVHYMNEFQIDKRRGEGNRKFYFHLRYSNIKALKYLLPKEYIDKFFTNSHGPVPLLKSECYECYNMIKNAKHHMSFFREKDNLTQELFTIYMLNKRKLIFLKNSCSDNYVSKNEIKNNAPIFNGYNLSELIFYIKNEKVNKFLCVNDVFSNEYVSDIDILYEQIEKTLGEKYNRKSKYENDI